MTLFKECIQALGPKVEILSEYETKLAFEKLVETFPVTPWGRIDWGKVSSSIQFTSIVELKEILKNKLKDFSKEVFLLWNYSDAPVVRCDLFQALNVIDDVTAVGSDTWFFDPSGKYVIEFFHEGEKTVGIK